MWAKGRSGDYFKAPTYWHNQKTVDRKDIRELHAKFVGEGDSRIAFLCETFRELERMNFILAEGCELRDSFGRNECIRVDSLQAGKKNHPQLTLKRIAA